MIRTADRKGNVVEEDSFQNNLLEKIYGSASGRALLRPLVTPSVSIAVGKLLDSGISAAAVKPFIWMNQLDMGQSAVSYHMKILCESGIVTSRQEGKWTHYCLSEAGRNAAADLLLRLTTPDLDQNHCCG